MTDATTSKKKGFLSGLDDLAFKWIGLRPSGYKLTAIISLLIVGGLLLVTYMFMNSWISSFFQKNGVSINNPQIATGLGALKSPVNQVKGDGNTINNNYYDSGQTTENIVFQSNKWEVAQGDFAQGRKNSKCFVLPPGENYGLLKYGVVIPKNAIFELHFAAHGSDAMNVVVSFPEVYEVVVGDSDYSTVTLKQGSSRVSVAEIQSESARPRFEYPIKEGTETGMKLQQRVLPNGDLWVQLDFNYWPDIEVDQPQSQTFQYEFKAPPKLTDSQFLHVGLLSEGVAGNSFEMIDPGISFSDCMSK